MIFDKYIWKFAEWCLNTPLLEMASDRNNKMSRIQSKSETINQNLFKWYLIPNSIDCNHWLNEIDDRFFEIQNLKWGKKRLLKVMNTLTLFIITFTLKVIIYQLITED